MYLQLAIYHIMEEIIKELENIVCHFEKEERTLLSKAKELLNEVSDARSYTCKYSGMKILINELTIEQVKEIVRDYQNFLKKVKDDENTKDIRENALKLNKYNNDHPYGG